MRINFWLKAWGEGNIGFHRSDAHPALEKHWPALEPGATVLVPLCGKSRDLIWLEQRGLDVIGVEFVESAVVDFFRETDRPFDETLQYGHRCFRAREGNLRIFVTDFIQFSSDYDGPPMDGFYDRGALVALPEDMRGVYVRACRNLLSNAAQGVLISMEYEPLTMAAPPFSLSCEEVARLWEGQLKLVERVDMLSSMPRAVAAGVQRLEEFYWVSSESNADTRVATD